jgi:hypothetical protein
MPSEDLPANHYLRIYKIKLGMALDGTTQAQPQAVQFFRHLVANLSALDPSTPVRLTITESEAAFTSALSGVELGRLRLGDV